MKFVKVTNKVRKISSREVEFDHEDGKSYTCLRRVHDKVTIWKLLADGIYVHREYVRAYKLTTA